MAILLSEQNLREHMLHIVQKVRASCNHYQNPYDLASELGFSIVESSSASSSMLEGAYLDNVILLNTHEWVSEERRRFTLYHEICHGLLREDEWFWSILHDQFKSDIDFDYVKERLCNVGAAEFLLPRSQVSHFLDSEGVSVTHIETLANRFSASRLATAIQIADCARHRCITVVATRMPDPTPDFPRLIELEEPNELPLLVEYSMPSRTTKYRVGRYAPIRARSIVAMAEDAPHGEVLNAPDLVPFKSGRRWEVDTEAVRLGSRVYALFNLEAPQPINDGQLSFF